jgi:hypothetical protein
LRFFPRLFRQRKDPHIFNRLSRVQSLSPFASVPGERKRIEGWRPRTVILNKRFFRSARQPSRKKIKRQANKSNIYHSWLPPSLLAPFCFGCRRVVMGVVASGAASILTVYPIRMLPVCKRRSGSYRLREKKLSCIVQQLKHDPRQFFSLRLSLSAMWLKTLSGSPAEAKKDYLLFLCRTVPKRNFVTISAEGTVFRVFCFRRAFLPPLFFFFSRSMKKKKKRGGKNKGAFSKHILYVEVEKCKCYLGS